MTSRELLEQAVRILDGKKAEDIVALDIRELTSLGDYFVIASGSNSTQVKTLAEEVEGKLSAQGIEPKRVEGSASAMWILMDYGDVVIHVFYHETRDFYCLERLWADAPKLEVSQLLEGK